MLPWPKEMLFNQKTTKLTTLLFLAQKGRDLFFFSGNNNVLVNTGSKLADTFVPTLPSIPWDIWWHSENLNHWHTALCFNILHSTQWPPSNTARLDNGIIQNITLIFPPKLTLFKEKKGWDYLIFKIVERIIWESKPVPVKSIKWP